MMNEIIPGMLPERVCRVNALVQTSSTRMVKNVFIDSLVFERLKRH